jgi:16S rRNA (adenine1518-N6/adenine1519-N6)-dimethyltransferase
VRTEDVRDTDWAALAEETGEPLWVLSNTPYYLTSPLLFSLLEQRQHVAEAVLTMQREVAERIVAAPRTKSYGILSVLLQLFAAPELLFTVPQQVFSPQPDVTSAVVRLQFNAGGEPEDLRFDDVRRYVRAAFNQRRKMLRNSLSAWTKEQGVGFPNDWGRKRAEALTPQEFATLARHLNTHADPVSE